MEAIILAGGLGKRLRSAVPDLPKCMARISNRPFLEYLLDYLVEEGVTRVVFSVGYKSLFIQNHFRESYKSCAISYVLEREQLGTGGAIKKSLAYINSDEVIVLNGDSLILGSLKKQVKYHKSKSADVTIALKQLQNPSRYGTVDLDENNKVINFKEKQILDSGFINTGCYIFNTNIFRNHSFPDKFSIENDFFQNQVNNFNFYGFETDGYFLDIGIPEDFRKAQLEIGVFPNIDSTWTLFLDRDGVINQRVVDDYVRDISQFKFLDDVIEAICSFSKIFQNIIVVTNQQGIGKGLVKKEDLLNIHKKMSNSIEEKGGRIDAVYYAPQLKEENSLMRKPMPGMAQKAKHDFPTIDFNKSIMIGDSLSDMEFAINAGLIPVYLNSSENDSNWYKINSLISFSKLLDSVLNKDET